MATITVCASVLNGEQQPLKWSRAMRRVFSWSPVQDLETGRVVEERVVRRGSRYVLQTRSERVVDGEELRELLELDSVI